jgi:hypothetical protein
MIAGPVVFLRLIADRTGTTAQSLLELSVQSQPYGGYCHWGLNE